MLYRYTLRLSVLLAFSLCSTFATAQSQPNQEQISVITFMGDVSVASMNQLLTVVNAQIRNGVHKIRLVISSGGGDPSAAFAVYNYLHNLSPSVEISTYNIGNVDSAAVVLFCAGRNRYTFPSTRFLIHGNSWDIRLGGNPVVDAATLQGNLELLKSLNQTTIHVIATTVNPDKRAEVESAVHGQIILAPDEAVKWGLAQGIKTDFMEGGATLVSVNAPPTTPSVEPKTSIQFTSTTPVDMIGNLTGGSCGLVPLKPLPPLGCKDLTPECVCDSNGNNCHWEWVCVPQ